MEKNGNEKQYNRPLGLNFFLIIMLFGIVSSIANIIRGNDHFFLYGVLAQGVVFKTYNSILLLIDIFLVIGIFRCRNWAYFGYIAYSIFFILAAIGNLIFVSENQLVGLGWKLKSFQFVYGFGIFFILLMVLWLSRYREKFE